MFNNPFDSFHKTVAEAKEEREQLDRLLTISTPRERLLVGVTALLLFILAVWLFFGSVSRTLAVDGVIVEAGKDLHAGSRSVQALVWVGNDVALQIVDGMSATIELSLADGEVKILDGKVEKVSAVKLSDEMGAFEFATPLSVRRVVVALGNNLDVASIAGRKCRIIVELGSQSPITLFRIGR